VEAVAGLTSLCENSSLPLVEAGFSRDLVEKSVPALRPRVRQVPAQGLRFHTDSHGLACSARASSRILIMRRNQFLTTSSITARVSLCSRW